MNPITCKICGETMVMSSMSPAEAICPRGCYKIKLDNMVESDDVNPSHYRQHPSGVECIEITEHMNFCLGNAIKYIFRADFKGEDITDLKKAIWYLEREISRRSNVKS